MNVLELQDSNEYQEIQDLKTGTIFIIANMVII